MKAFRKLCIPALNKRAALFLFTGAALVSVPAVAIQPVHCYVTQCMTLSSQTKAASSDLNKHSCCHKSSHEKKQNPVSDSENAMPAGCNMSVGSDAVSMSFDNLKSDFSVLAVFFHKQIHNLDYLKKIVQRSSQKVKITSNKTPLYIRNQIFLI